MGFIFGNKAQKKAAKAAEEANRIERQKGELQSMRQRLEAIRDARSAYANIQQSAENQGVATSSAVEGGQSSVVSQMGDNISFLDKMGYLTEQAEKYMAKAQKYQNKANMWAALDQFILSAASTAASAGAFSDVRLKTEIQHVETLSDGLKLYVYRWKDTGQLGFGPMAHEVKELRPWAYIPKFDGEFDGVDYRKLNNRG